MSAILSCSAWNLPMGPPKAFLSRTYATDSSTHPCASPVDSAATATRPSSKVGWSAAALAQQVRLRHPAAVERQLVRVRRRPADLGVLLRHGEAWRTRWHQDRGDLRLAIAGGPGGRASREGSDRDHAGDVGAGVGDEGLAAVDDPVAVFQP